MSEIQFSPIEKIETDKYIMKIDPVNQFMDYFIKPGIVFEADDAVECKAKVVARYPDLKFYVLAGGIEFFTITKKARELCASREHLDNTHCVAFYTGNTSLFLLGELFNKINKPPVPIKTFFNRFHAMEWLKTMMNRQQ